MEMWSELPRLTFWEFFRTHAECQVVFTSCIVDKSYKLSTGKQQQQKNNISGVLSSTAA